MAVFIELLRSQFFETIPYPTERCDGKTIVITGANTGLGFEAARHYVRLGAEKLIIACRSSSKGEAAKVDIEKTEGRKGVIDVWSLDLLDYESVKSFAKRLDSLPRLDILIENAGVSTFNFELVNGNEKTITTNVISTFLLTLLALPILKRSAERHSVRPTLVIVASEVHEFAYFEERHGSSIFATLNDPATAKMNDRYNVSKLLEVLVVREMCTTELDRDYPVTLNYVNPGWCHSELMREMNSLPIRIIKRLVCRTTEMGSRTLVLAGLGGKDTHGEYLTNARVRAPGKLVVGEEGKVLQTRVWRELKEKLETIQPGVTKKIMA